MKKNIPLLGVDTSDGAVKIMALEKEGEVFSIVSCVRIPYSDGLNISDPLKAAIEQIGGHKKNVAIALPDTMVMTQSILLDATLKEEEICRHVHHEASRYFNLPSNELLLDFKVFKNEGKEKKAVFWVAAKKKEVAQKIVPLEEAGLKVKIVDIASLALQRAYLPIRAQQGLLSQTIVIAHIGRDALLFVALKGQDNIYTAMETYSDSVPAENRQHDGERADKLVRTLRLFFSSCPGERIASIYLSGDLRCYEEIKKSMPVPIKISDALSAFSCRGEVGMIEKNNSCEFLLSLGLAMRGYDKH